MLHFKNNAFHQSNGWSDTKVWTMADLLEHWSPLSGEPLAERMAALQKAAIWAAQTQPVLSDTGQLHLDFWANFDPHKISEQTFVYKIGGDAYWELTLNETGLFFQDLSQDENSSHAMPDEQLFSTFWLYGPSGPIPDLVLRKKVLERLKRGFVNPRCPAAAAHFELSEYPKKSLEGLSWQEGNHLRTDFMRVIPIGIETGYWTWRDPPGKPGFFSFENFLHLPPEALNWISPDIRAKIEQYLDKKTKCSRLYPTPSEPAPPTPRELMDRAEALLQDPNSEAGVEALMPLLAFEGESDYWRWYVFNRLGKLRDNRRAQTFVVECLRGDKEAWFKKAVDVLTAWGFFYGDALLADRNLLLRLNWEGATAHDPDFREALEKACKIILRTGKA